MNQGNFTSN